MTQNLPPLINTYERTRVDFFAQGDGGAWRYAIVDPEGVAHDTIVLAPGRREFIEKKYFELGPELLARGYRLIFFEWRGQGLSTRYLVDDKRQRDHAADFVHHIEDFQRFHTAIIAPNQIGKLILHGHSMGSHLLLLWLSGQAKVAVAGAFLTAPMVALAGPLAHASSNLISWGACKFGYGSDYGPMQYDYGNEDRAFAGNPLTHDPDRFTILDKYFSAYPDMTVGGVTWDWLQAAIKSMYSLQRRSLLDNIRVPVLSLVGNEDQVTSPDAIVRYLNMIPKAETIILPGARHDVMNEISTVRDEAWRQIDGFLKRI
jgi:lysophospholipase